ncbi:uncharacterized protein LOC134542709 [Bacillus rossius redtenbacheri]|uniref:uncharacterized protein LOC134542709 n=1 Tax=Bacillus rossius redtenbacheri TaxID=93214 RepID=UPI002FDDC326
MLYGGSPARRSSMHAVVYSRPRGLAPSHGPGMDGCDCLCCCHGRPGCNCCICAPGASRPTSVCRRLKFRTRPEPLPPPMWDAEATFARKTRRHFPRVANHSRVKLGSKEKKSTGRALASGVLVLSERRHFPCLAFCSSLWGLV